MLALALLAPLAWADRIVVDATGGGDYTNLQAAIDAAQAGDYIVVWPGTYPGVRFSRWAGPVLAIDGPTLTAIDGGTSNGVEVTTPDPLTLAGFTITGSTYALFVDTNAEVALERSWVGEANNGVYLNQSASLAASGVVIAGNNNYGVYLNRAGPDVSFDGVTFIDNPSHLYAYVSTVSLRDVIAYSGTPIVGCSSSAVSLSYALLAEVTGSPYPSCVTASHVSIGVDPLFIDFSDDGDWTNDDLELQASSPGIDAGDPSCLEPDGSTCDLGGLAGPVADQVDDDADGMPEAWELDHGLDPSIDDGELDEDGDGLDNLGELLFGTDPLSADTDADGVDDLRELRGRFDPSDPSDQVPTASLIGESVGFLGEPLALDASGSSDPMQERLSYQWRIVASPSGSALTDADLPAGPVGVFTPDAVGSWTLEVEVDDGTWTASASLDVEVLANRTLHVPEDFGTWEEVVGLLQPGMRVVFGAGEFEINDTMPSGITLIGQGSARTVLRNNGGSPAIRLNTGERLALRGLTVEGGGSYGLYGSGRAWFDLRDVQVVPDGATGIYLNGSSLLTAVDLRVLAAQPLFNSGSTVWLGRSILECGGTDAYVDSSGLRSVLQGVWFEGGSVTLSGSRNAALSFVTIHTPDTGVIAYSNGRATLDDGLFWGTSQNAYCNGYNELVLGTVVNVDAPVSTTTCMPPLSWVTDDQPPDADARLPSGSAAVDAGDWRLLDADGSPADIGATGGPFGLYTGEGLDDPDADADGDGLSALIEDLIGADDQRADADGDGVSDFDELLAGGDPGDPSDNMPTVHSAPRRARVGETVSGVHPTFPRDPQGDTCRFGWDDGFSGPRELTPDSPGVLRYGWRLACGAGVLRGEQLVIVEEDIEVPGDMSLAEALAVAEDHHVLRLAEGVYVEEIDLRGRATALVGAGPGTELYNDVRLDHPGAWISDLTVRDQDLYMNRGVARRMDIVNTTAWLADVDLRNLQVKGGDLQLRGGDTEAWFVSVQGDLATQDGQLNCSAVTGQVRRGMSTYVRTFAGEAGYDVEEDLFIHVDGADAAASLLDPWPGTQSWNGCRLALFDPDGSPADVGHTGGPEASPVDVDADGMNDRWEAWRGVDDPAADPDADGLDNLGEFEANTDPLDNDTDDDRLPDGLDENPRSPDTAGLLARIEVDHFPVTGQPVIAGGGRSSDPAQQALSYAWTLETPLGSDAQLETHADVASFLPDVPGPYDLSLVVTAEDGEQASAEARVWLGALRVVPKGGSPQDVIDAANPGDRVVLQEGIYRGNLEVDKDLVITHAEGSMIGRLDGAGGRPAITVDDALLRLETLTLRPDGAQPGVVLYGGELELRQARIVGGAIAVQAYEADVDLAACQVLGADVVLEQIDGDAEVRSCVLGYASVPTSLFQIYDSALSITASVVERSRDDGRLISGARYQARLDHVLVDGELGTTPGVDSVGVQENDPRFLLGVQEADSWLESDLRLSPSSAAVDRGPTGRLDWDGTRMDIGAFGGAWGDWPGVDNDRDGYTNLEGDCDDADPNTSPDPYTGECATERACGGCDGGGSAAFSGWILLALLSRRRRHAAS